MKTTRRFLARLLLAAGSAALFTGQAAVTIDTDFSLGAGDASLDGQDVIVDHATFTVAGAHSLASLQVINGGLVTHDPATDGQAERALRLMIAGSVTIDSSSRIDASGKGYAVAGSPGAGTMGNYAGGGGGHGGRGHPSAGIPGPGGPAFGSIIAPNEWGGPGANSDSTSTLVPGGGLVHLEVGGTLTVEGAVRADGAAAAINNQGGGAGGTVYLKAATLRGAGTISANGGGGEWVDGGGGAGGRVALFFTSNQFTGSLSAVGAGGAGVGGAGTVYLKAGTSTGELRVVNGARGEWTPLTSPVAFNLLLDGSAVAYPTEPLTVGTVNLAGSAWLTHATGSTGLVVNASGNLTIGKDAAINVDGRGYPFGGNRGPGTGVRADWAGTGAGHGGIGGHSTTGVDGGANYDSLLQPTALGSQGGDSNGGPGTAGGGAIRLHVTGTLEVQGWLSASGAGAPPDNAGGGSGGSIWLTAGTLTGAGNIVANGGPGEWVEGGGGSGGRIALYFTNNQFTGPVTVYGGGGAEKAGAGTIYSKRAADAVGDLLVDNGNVWGNYTPITSPQAFRLTLSGRAASYPEAALTVARFTMPGEALLTHLTGQSNVNLHVTGDATLAAGARFAVDGRGYPIGDDRGPGTGARYDWGGSGGGHGGLGGHSRSGAVGGGYYGSLLQPTTLGSQGGNADGGVGTAGGGAIRLVVEGKLTLDGRLSADGAGAPPNNAGGGSGGSLWLTVGSLSGAGTISANGGPGEWVDGGGGSGGRIAIYYSAKDYTGSLTAFGGAGNQPGGAGTIYTKAAAGAQGHLLVDNGGSWGNYTPLQAPEVLSTTLAGRAVVYPEAALTLARLDLPGEAVLTQLTGQSNVNLHVLGDLLIDTNSTLSVQGRGYPIGEERGPGAGLRVDWGGSGASHGGLGGSSGSGARPTTPYGSILQPTLLGSQGGNADGGVGTAGGGAVRLTVDGTLTINGQLNADGAGAPPNNAGGGSGGSVWLTVARLAGTGAISANGGPGEWVDGGGGGGGRIAVYYGENAFAGAITAYGSGGHQRGGAGTLYTRKHGTAYGQLLVHNGVAWGNYTPLASPEAFQLVLAGMAYVYPLEPLTVRDLEVRTNSTLTHLTGQPRCEINVLNDALIAAGGSIDTDGRGYASGTDPGPGGGVKLDCCGSGGGHGGMGGTTAGGAVGGAPYGSITEPLELGSAGGAGSGGAGPAGGGVIRLTVVNTLTIDGRVSVNGLNGTADNSGGGSGGSIYLTARTIAGQGSLLADGGSGEWVDGGGGGGGRIALHANTISFAGETYARGGGGHQRAGAGTVYRQITGETGGVLVLDNGGNTGALTPFDVPPKTQLVLSGGSTFYPTGPLSLVSLQMKPGATLTHINGQTGLSVTVEQDLTVAAGAAINVDGQGYPVGDDPGPGAGDSAGCCGGGGAYGGNGGVSGSGSAGGQGYGSILEPSDPGSSGGGGSGSGTRQRSPGGGVIRLIVGGTVSVDGTVSANGVTAWYDNQGGAAGGSIWVTAGRLIGQGTIAANGGGGEWVDGGSGGGGRIALHLGDDQFAGTVTARGAGGGRQAGGAGTIYTRLTGEPVGQVLVENGDRAGALTPLLSPEAYALRIAAQAWAYGEEQLVLQSLEVATNAVLTHLKGDGGARVVVLGDASIGGRVLANGLGYPVGGDPGPGVGGSGSWAGGGAGHGGDGCISASGAPGGAAYGSELEPATPGSQGGRGDSGPGTDGGGVVRMIVGGTLTVDGSITASALGSPVNNAGGGSGGSIFLNARTFAGGGEIRAEGGPGEWVDGGSGAGGRIAIYRGTRTFNGLVSAEGAGGARPGGRGTIHEDTTPMLLWLAPGATWLYGSVNLEIAVFVPGTGPFTTEFSAWREGTATPIATVPAGLTAATTWNTSAVADGSYELRAVVRDGGGAVVGENRLAVNVNNAVTWHNGPTVVSETWAPGRVHVVTRELLIGPGLTLTLEPGAVVKFLPGARLSLLGGGKLTALGTVALPVTLTSFLDDSAGGDSNLDGDSTKPTPGSWRLGVNSSATLDVNDQARFRYHSQTYGGTLAGSETWTSDSLREITDIVTVPAGATLTIEAGAILKFRAGQGITIQAGGRLIAAGTFAQPVVFTSIGDDARGGDTNEDGTRSQPTAGDWRSLRFEDGATGELVHAEIRYGGNSVGNPWGAGGVIEALGGPLTVRHSIISDALKDGAFCYGTTRFENCLVLRCDRGLTAVGELTAVNCTLDGNRIGLLEHVGHLIVRNCIVSGSIDVGIEHDLGGSTPTVTYGNVWNPAATRGNYSGTSDRTGQDGNLSAAPRYKDAAADNFRLNYASPGIDAADGAAAPGTDFAGVARYDDPRTGNTGTAAANGAVPDIGAFEFVESAPSNIDIVVTDVAGPTAVTAGGLVHVEWTVANRGTDAFTGPWHDAVYLRNHTDGSRLEVGEILVGRGQTLGPGQSYLASADVRVPGGVAADYTWLVVANSRGDVFEGANAANNETTAALASTLTLPTLPLDGAALTAAFAAQEQPQWFQCLAPAGKDVRLNLDLLADQGVTELYIGRGFMPTPENHSARQREWSAADTSAVVSGAGDPTGPGNTNVFYVLAVGQVLPSTPQSFQISAVSAAFSLETVSPETIGNGGLATLDLHGSAFSTNSIFLVRAGGEQRVAVRATVRESGRAFATFDLSGFPEGPADVLVEADGLQFVLPAAVTVVAGGTPDFYVTLSGPGTTRAGRFMSWFVTYGNRGLVDLRLPLLRFRAPGATEIQLYDSTLNWADSFTFWALNPEVLLPTLGPGQEVTFEVRVKAMNSSTVQVEMMPGEALAVNTTSFNWATIPPAAGADATKWAAMVNGLTDRLGATLGDYAVLLERDLAELAASELRFSYLANINGRWLFGDEPEGVSTDRPLNPVPADYEEPGVGPGLHGPSAAPPGDGIRKTWWLVISVEDYTTLDASDPVWKWNNLPGTRKDARDLMDYAKKDLRTPDDQYLWAHDVPGDHKDVRRQTMLDGIRALKGKVDADDNVVVVYSGHGGLKPSGAPYLAFNGDFLSPVAFTQALDEVGAGTTYFVNDSCHSEAFNEKVNPANTTFVGFAGTQSNKISHDTASGGELIKNLKGQLRKCRSLGLSMELTTAMVTKKYENAVEEKKRQQPVLTNPSGASLEGKPWNDPSGFEQRLGNTFRSPPFPGIVAGGTFTIVGSVDPNDKYTFAGAGPQHWINADQVLPYEVVFENKPTAAAPAQEVLVTDDLDANLDWSTFELKSIEFNDARLIVPPGRQQYTTTTTVGTDTNEVTVDVSFNSYTGRITWLLRSRDANTGELPEDPFAGFLPPNDAAHSGEGSLTYTVRPKLELADGTRVRNLATIVFDPTYGANPPILTPTVTNAVDAVAPTSAVQALPAEVSGSFAVGWSGTDATGGSGIASYDVFVARGSEPFSLWQVATMNTAATFTGQPGSTYRFYSVARDAAGNTELAPPTPDAVTTIAGGTTFATWAATQNLPPTASGPGDDADNDTLSNFAEYAFGTNPRVPDRQLAAPRAGTVSLIGQKYLTLTYRRSKADLADVQFRVTASGALAPWAASATVVPLGSPADKGSYLEVTVRATQPLSTASQGFLRLEVAR